MWSAPLKRTAIDGTEYNLLLLDSEGIDAYDQTVRNCWFFVNITCLSLIIIHVYMYVKLRTM